MWRFYCVLCAWALLLLVLFAVVCNLEVCYLAGEITGLLKWEYKCANIEHLVLATLVVVDCLLVECLDELAVYIELCLALVTADCYLYLLTRIETEVEGVEVTVA